MKNIYITQLSEETEEEEGRELSGLESEQQVQQKLRAEQVEGGDGADTTDVSLEYRGKCSQMLAVNILSKERRVQLPACSDFTVY